MFLRWNRNLHYGLVFVIYVHQLNKDGGSASTADDSFRA